jgi:hypothetical protein
MEKQELQKLMQDEIVKYMTIRQFNLSKIPSHEHNGLDTVKISQKNLINNNKYSVFVSSIASETFTLSNLPNISQLFFNGIASNNASDMTVPGTLKATVIGQVQFGNCYGTPSVSGTVADISFANVVEPFVQSANDIYIDTTDLTKCRAGAANSYFVYVQDGTTPTPVVVATAKVVSYDNSTITITTTLEANWQITGTLILT